MDQITISLVYFHFDLMVSITINVPWNLVTQINHGVPLWLIMMVTMWKAKENMETVDQNVQCLKKMNFMTVSNTFESLRLFRKKLWFVIFQISMEGLSITLNTTHNVSIILQEHVEQINFDANLEFAYFMITQTVKVLVFKKVG